MSVPYDYYILFKNNLNTLKRSSQKEMLTASAEKENNYKHFSLYTKHSFIMTHFSTTTKIHQTNFVWFVLHFILAKYCKTKSQW